MTSAAADRYSQSLLLPIITPTIAAPTFAFEVCAMLAASSFAARAASPQASQYRLSAPWK
jgi:hypothetical protein